MSALISAAVRRLRSDLANPLLGAALVAMNTTASAAGSVAVAMKDSGVQLLWFVSEAERAAILAGTTVTDHTALLTSLRDQYRKVHLPPGRINLTRFQFTADSQELIGDSQGKTILRCTDALGAGQACIESSTKDTVTRLWCALRNVHVNLDVAAVGFAVDWSGMQLGECERVRVFGGGVNTVAFKVGANWTVTEGTYNVFYRCYAGNVGNAVVCTDGGNNNVFFQCRWQPLGTKVGYLEAASADGRSSGNMILGGGVEFPGNVSGGVQLNDGADGWAIIGLRMESLGTALDIKAGAKETTLLGNHFSSNTSNLIDAGTRTVRAEAGSFKTVDDANVKTAVGVGQVGPTITKGNGVTAVVRNSIGDYTFTLSPAFPDADYVVAFSSAIPQWEIVVKASNSLQIRTRSAAGALADCLGYGLQLRRVT